MRKRHSMLLLEMIIAFTLMVGVIAILISGLFDAIRAKNLVKEDRERILTEHRLRLRFALLFRDVLDVKSSNDSCYDIRYHGGIDHDPLFRTELNARLELKNTTLTLTSSPPIGPPRREVLCEDVTSLKIQFFDEQTGAMESSFPKHKPRLMKVSINGKDLPLFL